MKQVWDTSCLDWKTRILAGESLVPDLPLFALEADRAEAIFRELRAPKLVGQPRLGDISGEWVYPIIRAIFGSLNPDTLVREIQEYFLLVPKKNGKTMYASAIMIVAMMMNRRPNAEFALIAPTKEIASRSFRNIANMIKADKTLAKMFNIRDHNKAIDLIDDTHPGKGSYLQVLAADLQTITGTTALFILIDETHEFTSQTNAKQVFLEIRGALSANPDGCLIQISTQSKNAPAGAFAAELKMARSVRDGKEIGEDDEDKPESVSTDAEDDDDDQGVPSSLLPIIYELPPELCENNGWKDRKLWKLVNPNLGLSVRTDFLVRSLRKAEQEGRDALALFASQHFNVEMGLVGGLDSWAGSLYWDAAAEPKLTLQELIKSCDVITVGIDGGGLDDLLSLAILGRVKGSREWLHWSKSWAHEVVFERRKSEAARLRDFEDDGDLIVVKDMKVAFAQMADFIVQVNVSNKLNSIGMDTHGVALITEALVGKGIDKERITGIRQNWALQGAIKTAEVKLASGEMTHAGQRLMRWAVDNAKVEARGNAITIEKKTVGAAKIDPLMAMFDAVFLMSDCPEDQTSGWQTDDMTSLMDRIEAATAAMR